MSHRLMKIEAWALNIISRVKAGQKVEDSRVELKSTFPDKEKAARRIAGHANASFGSDVLWIIGLDEEHGIQGVDPQDLANWWPGVSAHFNGHAPSIIDLNLVVDNKTLVCLLFETMRPPYVVKNPAYGTPKGGAISFEVPWREGTSVQTATRNDLIRMLVPTISQPEIEILDGHGELKEESQTYGHEKEVRINLTFRLTVYLVPRVDGVVFPRCSGHLIWCF